MADLASKDVKSWVDASRYDLETARALLESRRYVYVLFMCQQALEKLLKARVTALTDSSRPGSIAWSAWPSWPRLSCQMQRRVCWSGSRCTTCRADTRPRFRL